MGYCGSDRFVTRSYELEDGVFIKMLGLFSFNHHPNHLQQDHPMMGMKVKRQKSKMSEIGPPSEKVKGDTTVYKETKELTICVPSATLSRYSLTSG